MTCAITRYQNKFNLSNGLDHVMKIWENWVNQKKAIRLQPDFVAGVTDVGNLIGNIEMIHAWR